MIIKTLKARILRALKSSIPDASAGAESPPPSPIKPGARGGVASVHADSFSDDGSFFDAREAETPPKAQHHARRPSACADPEPLDAWELVDDPDGRAAAPAPAPAPDPLLEFPARCPPGGEAAVVLYTTTLRGGAPHVRGLQRRARAAGEPGRGVPGAGRVHGPRPPGPAVVGDGGEGRAAAALRPWPRRRRRGAGARAPRGGTPRPPAAAVGAAAGAACARRQEAPRRVRGQEGQVRGVRGPALRGVRRVRRQP